MSEADFHTDHTAAQRLWTPDYVLDLLTAHFLFASYTALYTIVPPYVLDRGGEEWQIGITVGSFGVVALFFRLMSGRWVHSFGARAVAIVGAGLFAAASFLYMAAPGVWWLVPVRALQGVGLAIAPVATSTIVADLAPVPRRAEAMAFMGNSIAVAGLYAPVLSYWLLVHWGFAASFVYSGASALLAALAASRISIRRAGHAGGASPSGAAPLVSRSALFPAAVFLTYTVTTAPVNTFLPLLAEERDLGNPGLYFTVNSFTTIFLMLAAGPVADRAGRAAVIMPGLLCTAAAMYLLTAARHQGMFLGAGFLAGMGFGLLQPGLQSLTVDRSSPSERASSLATLQQAWDVGGSGGAFLMGPLAAVTGMAATFAIAGTATLAGLIGFLLGNARSPSVPRSKRDKGASRGAQE